MSESESAPVQPPEELASAMPPSEPGTDRPAAERSFRRFDRAQRFEHAAFLTAFTVLAFTGLSQKFAETLIGAGIIGLLGGIETTRIIHRSAAVVMMMVSIFHVLALMYRTLVRRAQPSMLPALQDLRDVIQDVLVYLGRRTDRPRFKHFSYVEKAEYLALVWGTVVMIVTGFLMWNPIASTRVLPGQAIPAAKAAHGAEALLAVLAILLWHFYHVHIRHLNLSMFTGRLSRSEMQEEHPAELEAIESGQVPPEPSPEAVRRRETFYIPAATLLAISLGFGLVRFTTFEQTAIQTVPPGETAPVFVPLTPTPAPTLPPTPTLEGVQTNSWEGRFGGLFRDRCGTCHGFTSLSGLSLASYQDALQGGNRGPAIVPGDPNDSVLVQMQSTGDHPGQLTDDELQAVIEWIEAGAPER